MSTSRETDPNVTVPIKVFQFSQLVCEEFEKLYRECGESKCATLLSLNLKMLEEMERITTDRKQLLSKLNKNALEKKEILFQLEREKKLHNTAMLRLSSLEDEVIGSKKAADDKIDKLESLLRQRDALAKSSNDHSNRLEERLTQMESDFTVIQQRYNELLKAYVDQVERSKMDGNRRDSLLEDEASEISAGHMNPTQLDEENNSSSAVYDNTFHLVGATENAKESNVCVSLLDGDKVDFDVMIAPGSESDREKEDADEEEEIAENAEPNEQQSVMMKEVTKLIQENQDLSATKNALNVVKNDLIRKLDDVTGEKLMLLNEVEYLRRRRGQDKVELSRSARQLNEYRTCVAHLQTRLKLYEDVEDFTLSDSANRPQHASSCAVLNELPVSPNVATLRSANEFGGSLDRITTKSSQAISSTCDSELVQTTQPKVPGNVLQQTTDATEPFFTRKEMAKLIAERNYYKQQLLELQDSLRYSASLRASLTNRTNSGGLADVLFTGLRSVAGEFAAGLQDLLAEFEPIPGARSEAVHVQSPNPQTPNSDPPLDQSDSSSTLRKMFGHFLGQTAGRGTEAFLGTGNEFAAEVSSQSFESAILGNSQPPTKRAKDSIRVNS